MPRSLRIFLCAQQSERRHAVPAHGFWAGYFRGAMAEAGHTCIEASACDWAEGLLPLDPPAREAWAERTWAAALASLRQEHARAPVDFFLSYLFPDQVQSAALAEIHGLGIPCVNFFCDNVREFRQVPAAFRGFDLHWVPEYKAVPLYTRARLPVLHAPMACWVPPKWREPVDRATLPVTFVGTRDEEREGLFAAAIAAGLRVELRGTGWAAPVDPPATPPPRAKDPLVLLRRQLAFARHHGWTALARKHARALRPLPPLRFDFAPYVQPAPAGDDYWTALRESSVCLGVNRYPSLRHPTGHPDTYSRLRDIEAPMAGACYLTEWTDGLDQLYELGTEIETYRDAAELAAKAMELAADAPRRARLRAAGQRRALADHTIARTIEAIARLLGCAQ